MDAPQLRRRGRPVDPEAREARRQQILAGARRCFMEKGFHAATTADISEAAGVSVANLYQYFPSKQDLVLAIAEQDIESDLELGAVLHGPGSLFERFETFFAALADEAEKHDAYSLRLEIFAEAQRNPEMREALATMDAELARGLTRLIEQEQERGEVAAHLDAATVADVILRCADGFYLGVGGGLVAGRALVPQLGRMLRLAFSGTSPPS